MMVLPNVLVGLLVGTVLNIIYMFIAGFIIIKRYLKKRKNNIDITILEMTRNGIQVRNEKGRREFRKDKGTITFTVRRFGNKMKDNLGYNIKDEDCYLSMMGTGRKYLLVAMKDKLVATFKEALSGAEWSEEEKEQLKNLAEKVGKVTPVRVQDIPDRLNITPILPEQTRFVLDTERDLANVYKGDAQRDARRMMLISAGVFFFTLVICLVIFVLMLNQGPGIAAQVAPASNAVPSIVPGITPTLPG